MIMEDNNENRTTPEYNSDGEPTLFDFVKSLFEGQGKILSNGDISIEMTGTPRFLVVHLYNNEDKKSVEVNINRIPMGEFTNYSGQGYRYKFQQRYREHIRNGRTVAEQYMEDTCTFYRDKILLEKAYH